MRLLLHLLLSLEYSSPLSLSDYLFSVLEYLYLIDLVPVRMLLYKQKKNHAGKGNRLLISITVLGSAGPIRFVVNEEELVAAVIDTALKSYAREGRLPVLGSDLNNFVLYCPNAGTEGN